MKEVFATGAAVWFYAWAAACLVAAAVAAVGAVRYALAQFGRD